MQEIKKRRIVLASVLKPVDDTRMFEKLGLSLAEKYEVHTIGYPGTCLSEQTNVTFHSLPAFNRLSAARLWMPYKVLAKLLRLRPALVILTTHELLGIGVLYRVLTGAKIIYDIQENYYRNIRHTNSFPKLIRIILAAYVRIKEVLSSPFVSQFFLAEASYRHELNFIGSRNTVLENKLSASTGSLHSRKPFPNQGIHFIFTGTLAESTGIFIALDLVDQLYAADPSVKLTIIGYCARPQMLHQILQRIKNKSHINLVGGDHLVPHHQILTAIGQADMGIISYPPNPSTSGSVPTKLYEYLGSRLPVLLIDHEPWVSVCKPFDAAITFQPENFNANDFLNQITGKSFYTSPVTQVFWEDEKPRLFQAIESLGI